MALTLKILSLTCVLPVAWSLTQEVAGLSPFNDKYFLLLNSVKTFRKNFNKATLRITNKSCFHCFTWTLNQRDYCNHLNLCFLFGILLLLETKWKLELEECKCDCEIQQKLLIICTGPSQSDRELS